jgi:hypothetical protein
MYDNFIQDMQGWRVLPPILCSFMRSSLWLARTACIALRPLGWEALLASLLLIVPSSRSSSLPLFLFHSRLSPKLASAHVQQRIAQAEVFFPCDTLNHN